MTLIQDMVGGLSVVKTLVAVMLIWLARNWGSRALQILEKYKI